VIFNSDVTVENQLFANMTGNVLGNIQGNVVTSTGVNLIDISNQTFNGNSINFQGLGSITSPSAVFTDIPFLVFATTNPTPLVANTSVLTVNNTGTASSPLGLARARGSVAIPTAISNGDEMGQILYVGHDGVGFIPSATITSLVDGAISTGVIPSRIEVSTTNSSGTSGIRVNIKSSVVEFAVPPKLPVVADDTARTALVPTPSTGMMIFMTAGTTPAATNKVQVYDSTAWVNLH
jgi:hypothetical protein